MSAGAASALIRIEHPAPAVWILRLHRPSVRNALSAALLAELADALERAAGDPAVAAVVLAGDRHAFSVGSDIKEMLAHGLAALRRAERLAAWWRIERFDKPLLAAVEGWCLGGGLELAMLADFIVAGREARFGMPEVGIGVMPGDGGTQRLPRLVGPARAMRMILTGEPIDAATAERWGLVAEMVAAGEAEGRCIELAGIMASRAPLALRHARRAVRISQSTALEAGLAMEQQLLAELFATEDRAEGFRAFTEKRPPRFRGA